MTFPQRRQMALPSLNVGGLRGCQVPKSGRGHLQSFHFSFFTMRNEQSFPCQRSGTLGKAAIAPSGFPFLLTIWKLVEIGIYKLHFVYGTTRHYRQQFLDESDFEGSCLMMDSLLKVCLALVDSSAHQTSGGSTQNKGSSRLRTESLTCLACRSSFGSKPRSNRAGYSIVAFRTRAAIGLSSFAYTLSPQRNPSISSRMSSDRFTRRFPWSGNPKAHHPTPSAYRRL